MALEYSRHFDESQNDDNDPSTIISLEEYKDKKKQELLQKIGDTAMQHSVSGMLGLDPVIHEYPNGDISAKYYDYEIASPTDEYAITHTGGQSGRLETKRILAVYYSAESKEISAKYLNPAINQKHLELSRIAKAHAENQQRKFWEWHNEVQSRPPEPRKYEE